MNYIVIFVIPSIALISALFLKIATGPYWQFPDPSYGNLIGSLSLVKHHPPTYVSSPGTPVEMLGAGIAYLFNLGRTQAEIIQAVLLNPEFYLNAMSIVMLLMMFGSSIILGAYVYRQTNDKIAAILSQLPILTFLGLRSFSFYDYVLPAVSNVTPEVMLISVSTLFNLYLFKLYFSKAEHEERWPSIILAFIFGLAMACKLTFASIFILPLIICRGWFKFWFILVSACSFVFWTFPIISSYSWIADWLFRLSTHVGEYGSGARGFLDAHQYVLNWIIIFKKCGFLIIFGGVSLLIVFWKLIKGRQFSRDIVFVLSCALSILVQLAMIAKHYDDHYLVSAINLFSPFFVLFYIGTKNKDLIFKILILCCIFVSCLQSLNNAVTYYNQLSPYTKDAVNFNQSIHAKYPDALFVGIFPMPMANPEGAFFMGNDWDNSQQDDLARIYPRRLAYFSGNINTYAPYVSGIYLINQRVWADDILSSGSHLIFVAPKGYDFSQTPYKVVPLEQGKYARAFLLAGSTEKQANEFFEAAMKLIAAGDYPHAFAFALKSHDFHYQPVQKVEMILNSLYSSMKHQ